MGSVNADKYLATELRPFGVFARKEKWRKSNVHGRRGVCVRAMPLTKRYRSFAHGNEPHRAGTFSSVRPIAIHNFHLVPHSGITSGFNSNRAPPRGILSLLSVAPFAHNAHKRALVDSRRRSSRPEFFQLMARVACRDI